jgi:hypothetical protein
VIGLGIFSIDGEGGRLVVQDLVFGLGEIGRLTVDADSVCGEFEYGGFGVVTELKHRETQQSWAWKHSEPISLFNAIAVTAYSVGTASMG